MLVDQWWSGAEGQFGVREVQEPALPLYRQGPKEIPESQRTVLPFCCSCCPLRIFCTLLQVVVPPCLNIGKAVSVSSTGCISCTALARGNPNGGFQRLQLPTENLLSILLWEALAFPRVLVCAQGIVYVDLPFPKRCLFSLLEECC